MREKQMADWLIQHIPQTTEENFNSFWKLMA